MTQRSIIMAALAGGLACTLVGVANAETANPPKPAPAASTANQGVYFEVIELTGKPRWAKVGVDPKASNGWSLARIGDRLGGGIQINCPLRSQIKLAMVPATPATVVMLEASTLASIDDLVKGEANAAVVRLGLAYGAFRAGVAEGDVRSDLEIRSPVATLSKRGTWGFRFYVERGTGRWEMSLAERGLVEARNNLGQSRLIRPGQWVNQFMARWIESVRFNRPVFVQDLYGLKGSDLTFFLTQSDGLGILLPGGNQLNIFNEAGRGRIPLDRLNLGNLFTNNGAQGLSQSTQQLRLYRALADRLRNVGPIRLNDGDFGVGFGFVPINLQNNARVKQAVIGGLLRSGGHR